MIASKTTLLVALLGMTTIQPQDPVADARALVEAGRSLEALRTLEAAAEALPEDAAVHHALGAVYAASGRLTEALAAVERAVSLAPDEILYTMALGEIRYRTGDAEGALVLLEAASALPEALLLLAAAHETLGQKEAQYDALTRYLEARPDDRGARLLFGEQLTAANRGDEAIALYRDGLEREPNDAALLYRLSESLSRRPESFVEAESVVRRALELEPGALEPSLLLARLLERQERHDASLVLLESLREAHPGAPQVHYQLATAYQRAGRGEEAASAAERFQDLSRKQQEAEEREARLAATYKRAVDLLQKGDMPASERAFGDVLAVDPDHAQTHSMLAKIAFSRGDVAAARRRIADAIAGDDAVAEFHYLKALFARQAGSFREAASAAERALTLDPAIADAWSLLGTLLLDAGAADKALECFQKAAALEPSNATTQLNLASAYAALGDDAAEEAAMDSYRRLSGRK